METSRLTLAGLVLALIAGMLFYDGHGLVHSLAGIALLLALLGFGQDSARTPLQSLAFALPCGLATLCAFAYPLTKFVGEHKYSGEDVVPPVFWVLATAIFWFVDRQSAGAGSPQPVSLSGYTPVTRETAAAPVRAYSAAAAAAAPAPVETASPTTESTLAAATPPELTGKEVSIYINMVGEGMNVLRSVRAEHLGRDFYIIVDDMPADENWEFVPGQVVRCKKKSLSNGKGMVAYEEAPRAQ